VGGKFKAFEGQLEGENLLIVPGKQICTLAEHALEEGGLVNLDFELQRRNRRRPSRPHPRWRSRVRPQGRQQGLAALRLSPAEEIPQQIRREIVGPTA
jgi:hypothetical protein